MADSPTTTNQTAAAADQVMHELICGVAVKAAEAAARLQFPFLNLPVVGWAFDRVMQYMAGQVYTAMATGVNFVIIDHQTKKEGQAVTQAAEALRLAISNQNPAAISVAKDNFSHAFGQLIHYDGSATP